MSVPETHRLSALEVKLLDALQKLTAHKQHVRWAKLATAEELKAIRTWRKVRTK